MPLLKIQIRQKDTIKNSEQNERMHLAMKPKVNSVRRITYTSFPVTKAKRKIQLFINIRFVGI